jgi:hypothetical protein
MCGSTASQRPTVPRVAGYPKVAFGPQSTFFGASVVSSALFQSTTLTRSAIQ